MAALANPVPRLDTNHIYDADAFVFSADFQQPLQAVEKQAFVELPPAGGYRYVPAQPYRADGIISHNGGYSQVSGHPTADGAGVTTLATAVVEGLNILEVVAADRMVAQIISEHRAGGNVPSVSFIGTRFENLRIAGQRVEIEPHLEILGPKPDDDESYFNDGGVFDRIAHQYSNIKRIVGLPQWARDQFDWDPAEAQRTNEINCSLVSSVSGAPGRCFGHVIDLPNFGQIFLAELKVIRTPLNAGPAAITNSGPRLESSYIEQYKYRFQLTMIRTEQHGSTRGRARCCYVDPNGQGTSGGGITDPPPQTKKPPAS
jgi:hypothetical protein